MGGSGPAPPDPMTELAEGSAHLHELYLSYVQAGFLPAQALYLCGQILRGASAQGPSSD